MFTTLTNEQNLHSASLSWKVGFIIFGKSTWELRAKLLVLIFDGKINPI